MSSKQGLPDLSMFSDSGLFSFYLAAPGGR
jgi:hypothetical protein